MNGNITNRVGVNNKVIAHNYRYVSLLLVIRIAICVVSTSTKKKKPSRH